jgi:hypothetical protein
VNFIAEFVEIGGAMTFTITDSLGLVTDPAAQWSHEPLPGVLIVPGPPGDRDANLHVPLPAGFNDFFPALILEVHPGVGFHEAVLAIQPCLDCPLADLIPEPGTWALLVSGCGLIALCAWRRRRAG